MIQPTTRFGQFIAQRSLVFEVLDKEDIPEQLNFAAKISPQEMDLAACNLAITPECLRTLYNVGDTKADRKSGAILGIAGFLEASSLLLL